MRRFGALLVVIALAVTGCGGEATGRDAGRALGGEPSAAASGQAASPGPSVSAKPSASAAAPLPMPGNPNGKASVPAEARAVDTSRPTRVIGDGTAASCTSEAVVAAVAAGGIITFSCGPAPV